MRSLILLLACALFSSFASADLGELQWFAAACQSGSIAIPRVLLRSPAAKILASLQFNPDTSTNAEACFRQNTTQGHQVTNAGAECNFITGDSIVQQMTTLYFPAVVKADLVPVNGTNVILFEEGHRPVITTVNEKGESLNRPGGKMLASCDQGANASFLLFEQKEIWLLEDTE